MNTKMTVDHKFCGYLEGHGDMVTSIVSGFTREDDKDNDILVSGSRDKRLLIWKLSPESERSEDSFGEPYISLTGHNHFVSDLSLSADSNFVLSSSWDKSMRLWSLKTGKCIARFFGSQKEVSSCTFSNDSRQIFSSGFDNKLTLWNTKGFLKAVSGNNNHLDNVSRIRYSPSAKNSYYASVGWDGKLKIWTQFFKIKVSFVAHEGPINALAINTNGMYLATGGRDQTVKLWKISDIKKEKASYKTDSVVNDLAFNPEFQWVAAAADKSIAVWDVSQDDDEPIVLIKNNEVDDGKFKFTSIAWSSNGQILYCGCSDGKIRVFNIAINSGSE